MNKIIAAFDGLQYSESTRDYAIYLSKQTETHLIGVFLDDPTYTSYKIYDLIGKEGVSEDKINKMDAKDKATRSASSANFEKACQQAGLEYTVHHDRNVAILELKHESIYADMMVIDSKETLTHYNENLPTRFIRDLLSDAQCPVLIVPQNYRPLQKVILLYDGEPSSVYAVKMFSYLLPQLMELETEVISVNPAEANMHLPDNRLMKEFMKNHFPNAKYTVIKGLAEEEINHYLKLVQENSIVVLGSSRRGAVSRLFRESMVDKLLKEVKLPLFIAHNK